MALIKCLEMFLPRHRTNGLITYYIFHLTVRRIRGVCVVLFGLMT